MTTPAAHFATLLVSCPDRKGIVAALAQLLYGHGANIVDADQHTDTTAGQFFQRIVFDLSEVRTDRVSVERGVRDVAERFGMSYRLVYAEPRKKVAIFVSRYEHCLYDLLSRHRPGELPCDIRLVIANHPDLEDVAAHFGVAVPRLPGRRPTTSRRRGARARAAAKTTPIDLVVLARYMQILSRGLRAAAFESRDHQHPPLVPAGVRRPAAVPPGVRARREAHRRDGPLRDRASSTRGRSSSRTSSRISHRDAVDDLVRKGRDLEQVVLARAVRAHLEDRILVYGNKTVVFD